MTMRLKDKVAVITGSASGLGFTYCKAFLKEGAKVVVNDISRELVDQAVRDLSPSGPVMSAVANVCDQAEVENMVATVVQTFGRLDILVNNAGGSLHTPYRFEEIKGEDWDKVVDVNLKGAFFCCQSAVKQFRKQGGGQNCECLCSGRPMAGIVGRLPLYLRKSGPHWPHTPSGL